VLDIQLLLALTEVVVSWFVWFVWFVWSVWFVSFVWFVWSIWSIWSVWSIWLMGHHSGGGPDSVSGGNMVNSATTMIGMATPRHSMFTGQWADDDQLAG
jgi:hypothetical protein